MSANEPTAPAVKIFMKVRRSVFDMKDAPIVTVSRNRRPGHGVRSIRSGCKSLVGPFSLRHALDLRSYLKPLIPRTPTYHHAQCISRDRKSVSYLPERGTPRDPKSVPPPKSFRLRRRSVGCLSTLGQSRFRNRESLKSHLIERK